MLLSGHLGRRALHRALVLFLLVLGLASSSTPARAAEPPPTFELEWSLVPYRGPTSVPLGITADAAGNVYVTQRTPEFMFSFTGDGVFRFGWEMFEGGCPPIPSNIALDPNGNFYVTDYGCSRVQKFDPNRVFVGAFTNSGGTDGGFSRPCGIAFGPDGSWYIADTFNHRIRKMSAGGVFLFNWGSFGTNPGQFNTPFDVATDAAGRVYVLDSYNQRVQVFDGSGAFLRAFGDPGFGADHLIQPQGLDVDDAGNVYVADTGNHQVVKYSPTGQRLVAWDGHGSGPGQMSSPNDVAVDGSGHVFVVDSGNKRIERFAVVTALIADLHVEPRTINARSGGKWINAYIEPPSPYAPADIDVASLSLNGVAVDPAAPIATTDIDGDGVVELSVRFSRVAIAATATPGVTDLALSLSGTVAGQPMTGQDAIRVVGNSDDILVFDPGVGANAPAPGGGDVGPFELRSVTNPIRGGAPLIVLYRAPGRERAVVDVIDLSGRRVRSMDLSAGSGLQSARLAIGRSLTPGIYLVRVTQGRNQATSKFAVLE